jgi:hypothetical protein
VNRALLFLLAADAVLVLHALFVGFVVIGLVLIVIGRLHAWRWVRNPWFRLAHLAAITIVVVQSWLGASCPLTTLEAALRRRAGDAFYAGSFIAHWLEQALFYEGEPWVFSVVYTAFAAAVAASWYFVRPRPFPRATRQKRSNESAHKQQN